MAGGCRQNYDAVTPWRSPHTHPILCSARGRGGILPRPARAPPEGPAASPLDLVTSQRRREGPVVAWSGCKAPQRPTCPAFDPCYSSLLFQLGDRGAAKARRMAPPLWRHSEGVTTLRACYLNPPRTRRMPRRRAVGINLLVEPLKKITSWNGMSLCKPVTLVSILRL